MWKHRNPHSTPFLIQNTYPNYPYTLAELIGQRQPDNRSFKESELWYVLYALAAAKHDIAGRVKKVGDIKPENLFVNEEGQAKIACQYSWPDELPSFARALDLEKFAYNGLLAPEDLSELQRGALENDANGQS
jgi:serine/threonine protein kinase